MTDNAKRIIITGEKQSGKSSLARDLAARLKENNLAVTGFIARGLWENSERKGFNLHNLKTGTVTPLARRAAPDRGYGNTGFAFMEAGEKAGREALDETHCRKSDAIFIDEVGKLELKGLGWSSFLNPVLKHTAALHIWIVRTPFVKEVCSIWQVQNTSIVTAEDPNAATALKQICLPEQ